jgi:hemin uptake protein HemP
LTRSDSSQRRNLTQASAYRMNEPQNAAGPSGVSAALVRDGATAGRSAEEVQMGADATQRAPLPKIIRFDALARCGDEIWIENDGQIYRLRKTRQGKLILTK